MARLAHSEIVIQLHSSRGVELNLLQSLSDHIVWLSLAGLCSLDGSRLINISLVIYIKLAERILETEDLILLELRILPECLLACMRRTIR